MTAGSSQHSKKLPTGKRRRKHARDEGAVMLVVMLILMIATAGAAVSVHTTQSELQAAGQDRLALQTAYLSEAAIMTTTAWIDKIGNGSSWQKVWDGWGAQPPPDMAAYGEPAIDVSDLNAYRHHASRTAATDQMFSQDPTIEFPPVTESGASGSGGGGGGSGGATTNFSDASGLGSFGPRQAFGLDSAGGIGPVGYVVDITDCFKAPSTFSPGNVVGGGPGLTPHQFYCVLTAHGRIQLPTADRRAREWTFGGAVYSQDMFMSAHDSRATILSPEVLSP
jgi:hypothetical protein